MRFLDRLSDLGARPDDPHDERLRHGTLIFASMVIALISLIWVATYLAYGYPTSAAIPALYQLTTVVGLIVLARTRRFGVFPTTKTPRVSWCCLPCSRPRSAASSHRAR
jgi:adenylate cyclase